MTTTGSAHVSMANLVSPGTKQAPAIPITVELGSVFGQADWPTIAAALKGLEGPVSDLVAELGVPGLPEIEVKQGDWSRAVRVRVHQVLQPYPPALLDRAWNGVVPDVLGTVHIDGLMASATGFPDQWLADRIRPGSGVDAADTVHAIPAFVSRLVHEIVLLRPSCLAGPAQIEELWKEGSRTTPMLLGSSMPAGFPGLVATLLDLGMGVSRREELFRPLADGLKRSRSIEDIAETVFSDHRPEHMEIHLNPGELASLAGKRWIEESTVFGPADITELYRSEIDEVLSAAFRETGVRVPEPEFHASVALPASRSIVKINGQATLPLLYSPWLLGLIIHGEALRRRDWLIDLALVERHLADLADESYFPAMVDSVLSRIPLTDLTRMFRALAREQISIRDQRGMLERLIQFQTIPIDPAKYLVIDDRLPLAGGSAGSWLTRSEQYMAFVRSGSAMRATISKQLAPVGSAARMVALDPDFDEYIGSAGRMRGRADLEGAAAAEDRRHVLREAIWTELASFGPIAQMPAVLAQTPEGRQAFRDLMAPEMPWLQVMMGSEISPDLEIQLVGTLSIVVPR